MTASATTRIAIVGAQQIESRYRAIIDRVPNAEITAAAANVKGLLDSPAGDFDALIVCGMLEESVQLAELDKHVFLSRDMPSEFKLAIANSKSADSKLMIGTPLRFRSDIAAVKQSLDDGELGDPGLLRIHCWGGSDGGMEARLQDEIDLATWFFGTQPTSIFAVSRSIAGSEDYRQVHFGFPADGMAMIDVNSALPTGDSYYSLSLIGSTGAAYADDHHNMQLIYQGNHPSAVRTTSDRGALLAQLREFVDSIQANRKPQVDGISWRATMKVVSAVSACLDSGRSVQLCGGEYEFV